MKKQYCKDCKKIISYNATRCYSCENKRKHKLGLTGYKGKFIKIINKEILIQLYTKHKKGIVEIAKIFNCGHSTIANYLKKFNILINKKLKQRKYCSCGREIRLHNKRCLKCWHKFWQGRNHSNFGKVTHAKYIAYKSIWMHSTWEAAFAKWLDKNKIKWIYEPKAFDLGETTYRPDFYLPEFNLWIEVKGFWRDDAKKKFDLFKQKYCGERIKIIDKNELKLGGIL